jgi:hypothetical protein
MHHGTDTKCPCDLKNVICIGISNAFPNIDVKMGIVFDKYESEARALMNPKQDPKHEHYSCYQKDGFL